MKLLLAASTLVLASASFGISSQGCQCTSECSLCNNVVDCTTAYQVKSYCDVDIAHCPNPTWPAGLTKGHGNDECGSKLDSAWDWLSGSAADVFDKMEGWTAETMQNIDIEEIKKWGTDALSKIPIDKLAELVPEQIKNIDVDALMAAGTDKLAGMASKWGDFDSAQWAKIKAMGEAKFADVLEKIPMDQLAQMSEDALAHVDATQLKALKAKLEAITLEDVAAWTGEKWAMVPVDNLASMSWEALQEVPLDQIGGWAQEQLKKIPVDKLVKFTGEQINKIPAADLAALGDEYWDKVPVYQIVGFGVELLQSAELLEHLNATHVASLTSEQWKNIPVESVTKFSLEKLQSIDYEVLGGWSKEMWDDLPVDTVLSFFGNQIAAIPADKVGAFTQEQWLKFDASAAVMFSGEQLSAAADQLKGMTKEQLDNFDWEQLSADALAALPEELRTKVEELASGQGKATFKELVGKVADAKSAYLAKLAAWQAANADPDATQASIDQALADLTTASETYEPLQAQLDGEVATMDGTANAAESSAVQAAFPAAAALLTVALFA